MKSLSKFQLTHFTSSIVLLSVLASPVLITTAAVASEQTVAQNIVSQNQRLRVAILDFDFASTGLTGSAFTFANGGGPGQGISELLTNRMVQNGSFSIIERSRVAEVLREQNLGASGRVNASTAAQIGRILGVDVVVVGSVTRFNLEERRSGGSILGIGSSRRRQTADVQVTARMINTTTSEIIAVAEGSGQSEQRGNSISIGGLFSSGSESNGTDRLLSEASEQAVDALVAQFVSSNPRGSSQR